MGGSDLVLNSLCFCSLIGFAFFNISMIFSVCFAVSTIWKLNEPFFQSINNSEKFVAALISYIRLCPAY